MGRIHLLEDDVINKIAAGEVVERPASVVKELVENALDAGSTEIEICLQLGGIRSIIVTDNGCGMSAEDALLALRRHATSKIKAADDLFQIATMGFRGEAIASIAAVSRFTLATSTGQGEGVKLTVGGGEPTVLPWHGPQGSVVSVENLFYNMPVRAKFLKAPGTEFSHCQELVQAFALAHPRVGFTLRHNGREVLRIPGLATSVGRVFGQAVLMERGRSLLGADGPALLYVHTESRYGEVEALLSPPGLEKATAKSLFTFANGRLVKDRVLRYGILRGYHSHILKGRFPVVLLHLRCDPALVDVNVHPAKTEVRFQYPDEVQGLIALAIRQALRSGAWAAPVGGVAAPAGAAQHEASAVSSWPSASSPVGTQPGWPSASSPSAGEPPASPAGAAQHEAPADSPWPSASSPAGEQASWPAPPCTDAASSPSSPAAPSSWPSAAGRPTSAPVRVGAESAPAAKSGPRPWPGASTYPGAAFLRPPTPSLDFDASAAAPATAKTRMRSYETRSNTEPWTDPTPVFDKAGIDALLSKTLISDSQPAPAVPPAPTAAPGPIAWEQMTPIGIYERCYLLFAGQGHLLVVDQHAFHERILFERLVADTALLAQSQRLLVPEALELAPSECAVLLDHLELLAKRGFTFAVEGERTLLVTAVPTLLANRDLNLLFSELAQNLNIESVGEPAQTNAELARLILATAACHGAVRAGEELPPAELRQLLVDASKVDFTLNCPHGRRVFKWWSTAQVAQWFDR